MFVAGLVHVFGAGTAVTDPWNWSAYAPSADSGLNLSNWSFFGLVILALLGVEVPLNMGVEIKDERSITRYLVWGSLAVMLAYLLATWAIMVTVPAADGSSAQVTALAQAVDIGLGSALAKLVALVFAAFFLFITVVYNYSFARLVFVSGLDQRLPAAMGRVNKNKVPSNAVWVQTVVAAFFTLVAFVLMPSFGIGGGRPIDIQTKVYDVLQAAVTVIWCVSMVILFVDVVIIIRRFLPRYEATRLAHPVVFYVVRAARRPGHAGRDRRHAQRLLDAADPERPGRDHHRRCAHRVRVVVLPGRRHRRAVPAGRDGAVRARSTYGARGQATPAAGLTCPREVPSDFDHHELRGNARAVRAAQGRDPVRDRGPSGAVHRGGELLLRLPEQPRGVPRRQRAPHGGEPPWQGPRGRGVPR